MTHGKTMSIGDSSETIFYFRFCFFAALFWGASPQPNRGCNDITTCAECIQNPSCNWCSLLKNSTAVGLSSKCLEGTHDNECELGQLENPQYSYETLQNNPVKEGRDGSTVQLQPQKVAINIRVGVSKTIEFKFKKANDYPVDLYYLMDFSQSMAKYKDDLSTLAESLFKAMDTRTSQLQVGFGSFVDKVAIPYADMRPEKLKSPCNGCASPYSYKNHMSLTNRTKEFAASVKNARISSNLDSPEGGLDALFQVIVCIKELNWRPQARRIIVFCSDGQFHSAGHGLFGGAVEPHDGACHLNSMGDYTHSLELDYPSVSLINSIARENAMNIIFAVTDLRLKQYTLLKNAIEGASVGVLKSKKDVVDLVVSQYNNISVSLNLKHNATDSVKIEFSSKCPLSNSWIHSSGCSNLKGGDEIQFTATITVLDCSVPEQTFEIKPIGMLEALVVHLKVHCSCGCDNSNHSSFQLMSKICGNSGNLTCGRCSCPDSHYGRLCQCKGGDSRGPRSEVTDNCMRDNVLCSNRGLCSCGVCKCYSRPNPKEIVDGDFCECDNFSCPGNLCNGNGECKCGHCLCKAGWTGQACDCTLSDSMCQAPKDNEVCSGRGDCSCGRCICHGMGAAGKNYTGDFCERCTECEVKCTKEMDNCVDCLVHKTGLYKNKCSEQCQNMFENITLSPDVSGKLNISVSSTLCQPIERDDNNCFYQYVPYYHGEKLWVFAEPLKKCPEAVPVIAIAAGVAGSVLLAGLILLILWKVFTVLHDKREFEKFERERADTKWGRGDNPLYRKVLTTHQNPTFEE